MLRIGRTPMPDPLPFWPKRLRPREAIQHLSLVPNNDVYQQFTPATAGSR
jgi:hypothetical protein